uniref:Uncharacterized protein n=1 Tax=Trichogramma kaykai TaxID=54128 RepID=A0ABD2XBE3_9HYME
MCAACSVPIVASSRERETSELRRGRGRAAEDDTANTERRVHRTCEHIIYGSLPRMQSFDISYCNEVYFVYLLIFTYTAEFESSKKIMFRGQVGGHGGVEGDLLGSAESSSLLKGRFWCALRIT